MKYFNLVSLYLLFFLLSSYGQNGNAQASSQSESNIEPRHIVSKVASNAIPKYDAKTFFLTTSFGLAGQSAFSKNAESLLISSDESGVFNAYQLDLSTGKRQQITRSTTDATYAVSFFPDGERILYTADNGGDELNHVFVRGANGQALDLTPGDNVKASFVKWSADESVFYLLTNERNGTAFDLYCYRSDNYARELIFQNDENLQIDDLSSDGRWLALTKNETSANSDVYLVDLKTDEPQAKLITEHTGDVAYGVYAFTPENDALIIATDEHGEFNQAWQYHLTTGDQTVLVAADWDVSYVSYSPTGKYQVVGINNDASTDVTVTERANGKALVLHDVPQGDLQSIRFSANENRMAFLVNGDTAPSNIFWVDLQGNKTAQQLTEALNPAIKPEYLVEGEVVRYPSFDQLQIPGILYKPHQASSTNKVPAIVWVHGGPGGQNRKGYRAAIQHLVNQGYAVFPMNNRGSSGYGKTFFHLDDRNHGEADLQDVVYARRYLETLDWVDADSIGIMGGSYGGYMVAAALAFEPQAFDVGVNIFGVTNWVRTLQSIPPWWESFKKSLYDEMGDPATDAERHRRISPLFHAENIVKPLLVVQGANDPRVLQVESDELVAAVRANGTPVEYIVFPDEGHGFRKRDNRITASDAYVEFLNTHLRDQN